MSGRSLWIADVLADAYRGVKGIRLEVYPGWETRGKAIAKHIGVIDHHTGPSRVYDGILKYMAVNSSIAPLCNISSSDPNRTGGICRVTVVASGKANHAGRGYLPWTGSNGGNVRALGWEGQNDGDEDWHPLHLEAVAIGNAALLSFMGSGVNKLADHKTYAPRRKVDRYGVDIEDWRKRVASIMENGAGQPGESIGVKVYAKKGDKGAHILRIQRDANVLLTYRRLGASKMSAKPVDGVGIEVDGHYGPATAAAIKQVMEEICGIAVSGDVFGEIESYNFLRYGFYADDRRHDALRHK